MGTDVTEVVVVGAGFAGLAAAQVLGRAQREVLVLGSGPPRNAEAEHAHNFLTRDGTPPGELLRLARDEVELLPTVELHEARVTNIEAGRDGRVRVRAVEGQAVEPAAVLLATGARDQLPEVPGLASIWGRRAHTCPFCDGEAYTGRRLVILAEEAKAAHLGTLLAGWTDQVTPVDPSLVVSIADDADHLTVRLQDGTQVTTDGIFVGATAVPRVACVATLGLDHRGPYVAVDGEGRTSHPGLWAAGDCAWRDGDAGPGGQVVAALASAARAATSIVFHRLGVRPPEPPPITVGPTTPRGVPGGTENR